MNKPELTEEEKWLIGMGRLIDAIKSLRRRTDLELKPAMHLCKQYQAQIKNEPNRKIEHMRHDDNRIHNLQELRDLALKKRAVVCSSVESWRKPKAAAFFLGLPVWYALDLLEKGLFVYEKGK